MLRTKEIFVRLLERLGLDRDTARIVLGLRNANAVTSIQRIARGNVSRQALLRRHRLAEERSQQKGESAWLPGFVRYYAPGFHSNFGTYLEDGRPRYADDRELARLRSVTRRLRS